MVSTYTTAAKPAASAMPPSSAVAQLAVERHREAPQAQEARHLKPEAGDSFSRLAHLFFSSHFFAVQETDLLCNRCQRKPGCRCYPSRQPQADCFLRQQWNFTAEAPPSSHSNFLATMKRSVDKATGCAFDVLAVTPADLTAKYVFCHQGRRNWVLRPICSSASCGHPVFLG